jgi:hypothetical protein
VIDQLARSTKKDEYTTVAMLADRGTQSATQEAEGYRFKRIKSALCIGFRRNEPPNPGLDPSPQITAAASLPIGLRSNIHASDASLESTTPQERGFLSPTRLTFSNGVKEDIQEMLKRAEYMGTWKTFNH